MSWERAVIGGVGRLRMQGWSIGSAEWTCKEKEAEKMASPRGFEPLLPP